MNDMRYYEDLEVGQTIECGSIDVTKEEMLEFAERYDPQPIHLDQEAAEASMFGDLIASGWLTCALTARLLFGNGLADVATVGALGIRDLKWLNPVYAGDSLSATAEISEKTASGMPTFDHVDIRGTTTNQHEQAVLSIEGSRVFVKNQHAVD